MKRNPSSKRRRSSTKSVLRLPDLEHAKAAVLNSRLDSSAAKIPRSLRPKKNPGNRGTEQPVNGKFRESAKGTQNYVECDPGERNPTRPVVAPKHKCSTDNRNKFDELH